MAGLALVLAVASGVRLLPAAQVFTSEGVRLLADGDPYYHVLRAQALVAEGRIAWRDPGLNHPLGADVPWPPLFDAMLSSAGWIASMGRPTAAIVESASAVVPVVLGVLGVLVGWLFARQLIGDRWALLAGLFLAVSPTHVNYSIVGRPDQHVLEALLLTAMLLTYLAGTRARSRRAALAAATALGVLLCSSFWTWLGSALHVAVLCALVAVEQVIPAKGGDDARRSARLVGMGTGTGALLMAATVQFLGPAGALARVSLGGVSAFPVILMTGAAAWCALLGRLAPREDAGWRRRGAALLVATLAVSAAILLLSPGTRAAVSRALLAAGRGNSWYASIAEFRPMFFAPFATFQGQAAEALARYGFLPVLACVGVSQLWTPDARRRSRAVVLGTIGAIFALLVAYMSRFAYYAALPLAAFGALGVAAVARAAGRFGKVWAAGLAGVVAVAAVAPTVSGLSSPVWRSPRFIAMARALAPFRDGALAAQGALLARWDAGHHARYVSGRPVIASPFGTEGGEGAMEAMAEFFLADDPAAAGEVLAHRGVRWLVIEDPANAVLDSVALTRKQPSPVTVIGDRFRGFMIHCDESYDRLVAVRLYYETGAATKRNPAALGGFRLVNEEGPRGGPPIVRLFEVVAGVLVKVRGAGSGRTVLARADVTTPLGTLPWTAEAVADATGSADLRLPYATGSNGAVRVSPYVVSDGVGTAVFVAREDQVQRGERVDVRVAAPPSATRAAR